MKKDELYRPTSLVYLYWHKGDMLMNPEYYVDENDLIIAIVQYYNSFDVWAVANDGKPVHYNSKAKCKQYVNDHSTEAGIWKNHKGELL